MTSGRQPPDSLFTRAIDEATAYRQASAERLLRRALVLLDGGEPGLVSRERMLLTLANVRAERGHLGEGLELLGALTEQASGEFAGLVHSQRGLMLLRAGRPVDALEDLSRAVPLVESSPRALTVALLNRGMARLTLGELAPARVDLERCAQVGQLHGFAVLAGRARFNLAYLSLLAADLPEALTQLDAARSELFHAGDEGIEAIYRLDRSRVLHAAGLLVEADAELAQAAEGFRLRRSRQDQAECELARALIALTRGSYPEARRFARQARQRFSRRGSANWALVARLAELRALLNLGTVPQLVARDAEALAQELAAAGLREDARMARLVAVRAHVSARCPEAARSLLTQRERATGADGIITRVYARQARAEYRMAVGERAAAKRELVAGLRDLHRYQASFGSLDLQTAVVRHGRALAGQGLQAALAGRRPGEVFAWSERARAMASRLPPVRPPRDEQAAQLLEELRYVRTELRGAELAGREDAVLRRRRTVLEEQIRQRSWYAPGPGDVEEPATLTALKAALPRGATLVAHMVGEGSVHALVVGGAGSVVVPLGPVGPALDAIRRLRTDLDALALRALPEAIRRSVLGSVRRGLATVHDLLWAPLAAAVGPGPVLLVPAGCLVAAPWTMLPALAGRPVALARSATAWLRAGTEPMPALARQVVFAAGPDLARAQEEVITAARLWPGSVALVGDDARADQVLAAVDGADLAHVAAHGVHETANPLFAALRLADGPLFGYDLARLNEVPRLVLLSSCDLGQVTERPGEEVVGMTAALLQQGARTVLASVARVSDDVACEVTLAVHQGLRSGLSPSAALAGATAGRDAAPFVAFGRGW